MQQASISHTWHTTRAGSFRTRGARCRPCSIWCGHEVRIRSRRSERGRAMTTAVKICGVTRIEDALAAARHGAHAIGLVFYKPSPRYVDRDKAAAIVRALPPFVTPVGLFVDAGD